MDTSFNTQDLRSAAQDYKRHADSHHKWENGESRGPGSHSTRPAKTSVLASHRPHRSEKQFEINRAKANRKRGLMYDTAEATDSSADEEVEPSAAPEPDAEIAYSYDAERGPSHGSQVLGYAVSQAVERYENNATEKLVKDEYLVLDAEGEPIAGKSGKRNAKEPQQAIDEDDEYEIL